VPQSLLNEEVLRKSKHSMNELKFFEMLNVNISIFHEALDNDEHSGLCPR
jgi:hypothetical protein